MGTEHRSTFGPEYTAHLVRTFRLIDELLGRCVHFLDPQLLASPLSMRAPDVTASRHAIVTDHCQRVRDTMVSILERHCVLMPISTTSAVRSARALVDEALIAVARLNPRAGREYAPLDARQTEDACRIVDELVSLLAVLSNDLGVRTDSLASFSQSRADAADGLAARLGNMKRITSQHGLARLEACVDALSASLASDNLTIGAYGDVNTGKSSLLNCIVGSAVLPVASIPTTVVPVQIEYGPQEGGYADFADAISERFERGRLAEFVDAHSNARNRRHVIRIRFNTPSVMLERGVTLVDIPGTSCAAHGLSPLDLALMYRCDLAVVLISAVGPLALDEAQLLDELRHAGTDTMVLVTKADLLAPEERWKIFGHIVRELWRKAGFEVPVYLISTKDTDATLCKAWQDGPLADYIDQFSKRRSTLRAGKVNQLRQQILGILEQRAARDPATSPSSCDLSNLRAALEDMRTQLRRALHETEGYEDAPCLQPLIDEVAHNAAALWAEEKDLAFDATRIFDLAVTSHARNTATRASWRIEQLRSQAAMVLVRAANALEMPGSDFGILPTVPDPPAFPPMNTVLRVTIPRRLGSFLGRWGFYHDAHKWLRRCSAIDAVKQSLNAHLVAVHAWKLAALHALNDSFESQQARLAQRIDHVGPIHAGSNNASYDWIEPLLADISTLIEKTGR